MMNILKCMSMDSYFCLLVIGQFLSWTGIGITIIYILRKMFIEEDEYES